MANKNKSRAWRVLWGEAVESFRMAIAAVTAHKLRSTLTLSGVVVGVFSIIVVMTAMRILQRNVESELSGLGTHTFAVSRWPGISFEGPSGWEKYRRRQNLMMEHVHALERRATMAKTIGAETGLMSSEASSRYFTTNPDVQLNGVTPGVFQAKNWVIEQGRAFGQGDMESARAVCVLGNYLAKSLFPHSSPVGEEVKFDGVKYMVVGYLEAKGGMGGAGQDNFMAIPMSTGLNRYGARWRSLSILVQAESAQAFDDTIEQTRGILRAVRKVQPGQPDDFEIMSNDSLIEQFRSLTFAVRVGVTVISSISLLAAGIGIMNIMLVSVTERTREIGVRRAIGAKKRNILTQFIMEAVVICQIGGLIGVILGVGGGNAAAIYFETPPVIPVDWVALGLLICSAVGVVFGTYPAYKAANLDPIESLRYE
ncbi:MAG TPA: ABC transporter permease [Verrucomicrobiae bacterium]